MIREIWEGGCQFVKVGMEWIGRERDSATEWMGAVDC